MMTKPRRVETVRQRFERTGKLSEPKTPLEAHMREINREWLRDIVRLTESKESSKES